ncbi:MAG: hypothetical protein ABJH93_11805 [Roseibium sp.]|uniref:hypothetical protein n=1 Tax=Roseibium sp. TaxID=1936156 RepID=UPI00329829A4
MQDLGSALWDEIALYMPFVEHTQIEAVRDQGSYIPDRSSLRSQIFSLSVTLLRRELPQCKRINPDGSSDTRNGTLFHRLTS